MVMTIVDINGFRRMVKGWKKVIENKDGNSFHFIEYTRIPKRKENSIWKEAMPEGLFWKLNPEGSLEFKDDELNQRLKDFTTVKPTEQHYRFWE